MVSQRVSGEQEGSAYFGDADIAVLSQDAMTAPAQDLRGVGSLLTVVGGRVV
jgi:predicted amidohydrolase YtcJ